MYLHGGKLSDDQLSIHRGIDGFDRTPTGSIFDTLKTSKIAQIFSKDASIVKALNDNEELLNMDDDEMEMNVIHNRLIA
jgi:hypothetical protein